MQAFDGYCRYGSNEKDWIKEVETNLQNCYNQCKTTDGCTAFAYDESRNYCDLYRGGPYTKGSGRENTKCYTMPTGNSTYITSYHFHIINLTIYSNTYEQNVVIESTTMNSYCLILV